MGPILAGLERLTGLLLDGGREPPLIVALVGAGGKTSALFALARSFALSGSRVLVTTTTMIYDPRRRSEREGRGFGDVLVLEDPAAPDAPGRLRAAGPRLVLGSARGESGGGEPGGGEPGGESGGESGDKLGGIDPSLVPAFASSFDLALVEADGARGRSAKAPSRDEPVLPAGCAVVIGVIGLDALGAPMDARSVHRPELFGALVGCAPGQAISAAHLARLAAAPEGLFKGAPPGASRILLLNKADAVPPALAAACASELEASGAADAVVVGALGARPAGARAARP